MLLPFVASPEERRRQADAARADGELAADIDDLTTRLVDLFRTRDAFDQLIETNGGPATRAAVRRFTRHAAAGALQVGRND